MAPVVSHFDTRTLAIGCLYLLTNKATILFPGSSRAHPSLQVVVDLATHGAFRDADIVRFPFWVYWGVWHDAIVPVLHDKDVQVIVTSNPSLRVWQNQVLLNLKQYDELISKIESYLIASLVKAGYLPGDFNPTEPPPPEVPETCPPEPLGVNWNPQGTVNPDTTALLHPDGSSKLTYKVVD